MHIVPRWQTFWCHTLPTSSNIFQHLPTSSKPWVTGKLGGVEEFHYFHSPVSCSSCSGHFRWGWGELPGFVPRSLVRNPEAPGHSTAFFSCAFSQGQVDQGAHLESSWIMGPTLQEPSKVGRLRGKSRHGDGHRWSPSPTAEAMGSHGKPQTIQFLKGRFLSKPWNRLFSKWLHSCLTYRECPMG